MPPQKKPKISAIILMAGDGCRFQNTIPKQFHRIAGKKVYLYTVEQFLKIADFETILLVCSPSWKSQVEEELVSYKDPRLKVILGGKTRQESSFLALLSCEKETEYVVIHDAVRPFVSQEILQSNIEKVIETGATDTCIPSADTIVHTTSQKTVDSIPLRSQYLRGQTPQSFSFPLILKAHQLAQEDPQFAPSDDCSLVEKLNHPISIVMGSEENIKITTQLDLFLAEQILRLKSFSLPPIPCNPPLLEGKRYALTGGTGGIGQAIYQKLKEAKAKVTIISRNTSPYQADLTSASQTKEVFEKIYNQEGPLDGLINCFGKLHLEEISSLSAEQIDELIAVNLTGVIYSCKWAKIKESGHIINIGSSAYVRGKKGYAIYAGAKAAVVNFTQGLAEERPNLYINTIVPQRTLTPMRTHNFPDENANDLLDPNEIAATTIRLLQNKNLSGSLIEVRKHFKPLA